MEEKTKGTEQKGMERNQTKTKKCPCLQPRILFFLFNVHGTSRAWACLGVRFNQ